MSKIESRCQHCGKISLVSPCRANRPYCSHACYVAHRQTWILGRVVWTEQELAILRERFASTDLSELSSVLGRSSKAIHAKAEELNIRREGIEALIAPGGQTSYIRHRVNEHFFDHWSPDMAYVLGFILADGCVVANRLLKIDIADRDLLYRIREAMQSTHPIREHWDRRSTKPLYCLTIPRKELALSLVRHGILPAKTFIAEWPTSPPEMFPHIVRGYFDGDGYVYYHDGHTFSARLETSFTSASQVLLQQLGANLVQHAIPTILYKDKRYDRNYRLRLGSQASLALYHLMYPECATIWLARKRERFEQYAQEVTHRNMDQ